MGGYGSGRRWHTGSKSITSDYRHLDVRHLQREGLLIEGCKFGWTWNQYTTHEASIRVRVAKHELTLSYMHQSGPNQEWRNRQYSVQLDRTVCHLGGTRHWFLCPAQGCGRRVAILYASSIFACRHCLNLAYSSQREEKVDRLARRAEKIRARLGWKPGILNGREWRKPKHMHWKTFSALIAEYARVEQASFRGILMQIGQPLEPEDDLT